MYGLVNKAVQGFITSNYGPDCWLKIRQEAGVTEVAFVGMNSYSDSVTYNLVGATSKILNTPAEEILEALGKYWMTFTAQEGYGPMLAMMGNSLPEFLRNIDPMHERLRLTFPHLQPPKIWVTDEAPDSIRIHYVSERPGLTAFAVGLLKGLAELKKSPITVHINKRKDQGADHDEFIVSFLSR